MQKVNVNLVNSHLLQVEGVTVKLAGGATFFCARRPVELGLDQALNIPFEDLVLAEYGYPSGVRHLPFALETHESIWERESQSNRIFVLGWYV